MKNYTLKGFSSLLLLLFCTALGAQDFKVDGIYYNILSEEDMTVAVTSHKDAERKPDKRYSGVVKIPSTVTYKKKDYKVVAVGASAFNDCSALTSIELPEGIADICESAFAYCNNLASIKIPESVTYIGSAAFLGCSSLTTFELPKSLKLIENGALIGCSSITSVVIPEGVEIISDGAFGNCSSLVNVVIPEGVTRVGIAAFSSCRALKNIKLPKSLTSIGNNAFEKCSVLESVVIPNGVTEIPDETFINCSSLKSITIPSSVTKIGFKAFYGCSSPKIVHIEDLSAWYKIEFSMYNNPLSQRALLYLKGEPLTEVVIPSDMSEIPPYVFRGYKSITSVKIPKGVTRIGKAAFDGCSALKTVHIDDLSAWCKIDFAVYANPLLQGANLFLKGEPLTEVIIPSDVSVIPAFMFSGCKSITSVKIPEGVTKIGASAFADCDSLTNVEIPNSVVSIGDDVFSGCSALTTITIPENVELGNGVIADCDNLKTIKQGGKILTKEEIESKFGEAVYQVVEKQPEFPGGMPALMKYLRDNIQYPAESKKNKKTGKVYVHFIVSSTGEIRNVKVHKSSGDKYLDMEAVRVIESMPKWVPGMQLGKNVAVQFTMPITFSLQ